MTALVLAEHDNAALNDATRSAITAAKALSDVHVLVAGHGAGDVAKAAAAVDGVSKVLHIDAAHLEHPTAESLSAVILAVADDYDVLIAPATTAGKNVMPRVAAALDVAQISEIVEVLSKNSFKRPIYAGNAIATVETTDQRLVITVRSTAFEKAEASGGSAEIVTLDAAADPGLSSFVSQELSKSDRPELTSADIIISGGRGMGSGENFTLVEKVADKLGAAIGASRAAVDAGYVPNDYQVGQTGKIVAPELYIAVGISGAIQHLAGMKDSKIIVAINKDEEAPIFQVADYGLVADLFTALPELEKELS
ncbi:electron transfer flavoprotein subunit alpha [alpha proteobacterium Q-1]|nr:electron transfer flavoprotein subunit alpha [alpha proteobacterium Q-1]